MRLQRESGDFGLRLSDKLGNGGRNYAQKILFKGASLEGSSEHSHEVSASDQEYDSLEQF